MRGGRGKVWDEEDEKRKSQAWDGNRRAEIYRMGKKSKKRDACLPVLTTSNYSKTSNYTAWKAGIGAQPEQGMGLE